LPRSKSNRYADRRNVRIAPELLENSYISVAKSKTAVTTADLSVRKRAISGSEAILRDFGLSALTNGIVTLHHAVGKFCSASLKQVLVFP
jgi:hypothetical protein